MLTTILQALRSVRRAPALGIAAVLCIGLGASATTTVSTLVSATLLRPVPFPDAERLVRIWFDEPGVNARVSLSIPEIGDFARMRSFDAFAGTARVRTALRLEQGAERVRGEAVSRGYFDMLGIRPAIGRLLAAADHAPDAPAVIVLSHGTWARHYGSDAAIVGRELRTERAVYTIVGVTEEGFDGTVEDDIVEFFVPVERYEPVSLTTDRSARPAWVIGRLAPGTSILQAQTEAEGIRRALAAEYPETYRQLQARVEPFGESWRERLRSGGGLLFAAAALLLMIAAVNVGCLLLARVQDRRRELAIRTALGAGRGRIVAQLLVEALILAAAGGALGALAGPWVLDGFMAISPPGRLSLPRYLRLEPDAITVALAVGALSVAGILAGTVPALFGRQVMPGDVLRASGRGTLGRGAERRWGALLIASETALTLVLLVAGGLLVRSYAQLSTADLGFDRERIARLAVTLSRSDVGDPSRLPAMYERLQRELAIVPGVTAVGLVSPTLPPWEGDRGRIRLEGVDLPLAPEGLLAGTHLIDQGFLPMLGARIVAGRNVEAGDARPDAAVAIISRSLTIHFGGPERALGRSITFVGDDPPTGTFRVVGVAEDLAYDGLIEEDTRRFVQAGNARAARYDAYVALARFPNPVVSIGAATMGQPQAVIEPLRRRIGEIAPASAVHWVSTMDEEIALEYAPTRFYTLLVLAFSSSALALTSVGLFALLSHAAARRTSEIGLRLALGASRAAATGLLLKNGLWPLVAGVTLGGLAAAVAARAMAGLLYGVGRFDVLTFTVSVVTLVTVALAAGLLPARRIASIDPVTALRTD